MNEKKLKAFLLSVQEGSFSKAAEKLGYTQSALTQMMHSFEEELGCRLLHRDFSGIRLTAVGEELLPYIQAADAALFDLRRAAENRGDAPLLRIGTYSSVSKGPLPNIIKEFQASNADAKITISVGGQEMAAWLREGKIDIAFADEALGAELGWYPLWKDPFVAVLPPDMPVAPEKPVSVLALQAYTFIKPEAYSVRADAFYEQQQKGFRRILHMDSDDDAALLSMVEQGIGVTFLPRLSVENAAARVKTAALEPEFSRTLGIVYQEPLSRTAKKFLQFIKRTGRR